MKRNGYTIVELSVVLVIIALLVIGVASGISLVKQAKLRSIITDFEVFRSMIDYFDDKYHALPGDMTNAFSTWGTNCAPTAVQCNGNGDGHITHSSGTTGVESFLAWLHLYLAGFTNGQYSGTATIAGQATIGVNVPGSKVSSDAGWSVDYSAEYNPPTNEGQYLQLGKFTASNLPITALFKPDDAYNIDSKIDDGSPRKGLVFGVGVAALTAAGCYNNSTINATYNLTNDTATCSLRFVIRKY
jgi:prepilin-type N-terminal cleavage/methylation domain-containing protein